MRKLPAGRPPRPSVDEWPAGSRRPDGGWQAIRGCRRAFRREQAPAGGVSNDLALPLLLAQLDFCRKAWDVGGASSQGGGNGRVWGLTNEVGARQRPGKSPNRPKSWSPLPCSRYLCCRGSATPPPCCWALTA